MLIFLAQSCVYLQHNWGNDDTFLDLSRQTRPEFSPVEEDQNKLQELEMDSTKKTKKNNPLIEGLDKITYISFRPILIIVNRKNIDGKSMQNSTCNCKPDWLFFKLYTISSKRLGFKVPDIERANSVQSDFRQELIEKHITTFSNSEDTMLWFSVTQRWKNLDITATHTFTCYNGE